MMLNKWLLAVASLMLVAPPVKAGVRTVPGILVQPFPAVVRSTTVVMPVQTQEIRTWVAPLESRTYTSSAVVLDSTLGSASNFGHRLGMLRDQITGGEQQGLLSTNVAADLLSRYQNLAAELASNPTMTRDRYDAFEQEINLLNQDVSNAMSR